jgi:cardiolipin synthase
MQSLWVSLFIEGYLLTLLLVPFVLLQRRKQPVSILAWIMAIVSLPYVGSLLFLAFGINRVARRASLKQASKRTIDSLLPTLTQYQVIPGEQRLDRMPQLVRLAHRVSNARPCHGNSVELLSDTNRTLGLIEQAILAARESIHLEYYIWQPDRTGRKLRDLLVQRARDGIKVRFLFDGIGSLLLGRKFLKPMRDAGIEIASALPGASVFERWSFNLRNHRKIVIVDGLVGFTGGMNIGDEYLGRNRKIGYWRDTHLRLVGPSVLQLQQVFAEDWFFATGQLLTESRWFPEPREPGNQVAQVIGGGPDGDVEVFHSLFFAAINEARERITIATSYFVPTPALVTALEAAAHRGVNVRLMVPAISDHRWMITAGRGYYESLLDAGVEIYEYHKGLLHSKTLTIDGVWSLVGTPNFDTRSLILNFEVAVVLPGPQIALQLEEQFADDLQHSRRIHLDEFRRRSLVQKIFEQVLKLFSPIL